MVNIAARLTNINITKKIKKERLEWLFNKENHLFIETPADLNDTLADLFETIAYKSQFGFPTYSSEERKATKDDAFSSEVKYVDIEIVPFTPVAVGENTVKDEKRKEEYIIRFYIDKPRNDKVFNTTRIYIKGASFSLKRQ